MMTERNMIMTPSAESRFAAFFAAIACAIFTVGVSVAPAVNAASGLVA
jgi:hypothetical protein